MTHDTVFLEHSATVLSRGEQANRYRQKQKQTLHLKLLYSRVTEIFNFHLSLILQLSEKLSHLRTTANLDLSVIGCSDHSR